METDQRFIAVCGIDCSGCPLRTADTSAGSAEQLVDWFRSNGWLAADEGVTELMERGPYCRGCRGDRGTHWSPDCWILRCCVDERELLFCCECDQFPCDRLSSWAAGNRGYTEALARLRRMKDEIG